MFPTKILLATDGSEDAIVAARNGLGIANKTGSEFCTSHTSSTYRKTSIMR